MTMYELSRAFWDYAFENPDKIKPVHIGIYFFSMEHCNRLGWKQKFGLPTSMVIEAIGVKSYSVYKKAFDELVNYGFYDIIQYSKNQYSSNVIALKDNCKANKKALNKALATHASKQEESTVQSTVTIDKQITNNNKPITTIDDDAEKKFDAPLFIVPDEVPVDTKGLINIYVAGIKIYSVDDFVSRNFPTLCDSLQMKMGKEAFIKKVAAFEERNADAKYLNDSELRKHFSNYMLKYIPEQNQKNYGTANKGSYNTGRGTNPRGTSFISNQRKTGS